MANEKPKDYACYRVTVNVIVNSIAGHFMYEDRWSTVYPKGDRLVVTGSRVINNAPVRDTVYKSFSNEIKV